MRVSEALAAAKGLIGDERYWVKGTVMDDRGRMCAVGALQMAIAGNARPGRVKMGEDKFQLYSHACLSLMRSIHLIQPPTQIPASSIPGFNDAALTTHEDIMLAFDTAISRQRITEGVAEPVPVEAPEEELVLA